MKSIRSHGAAAEVAAAKESPADAGVFIFGRGDAFTFASEGVSVFQQPCGGGKRSVMSEEGCAKCAIYAALQRSLDAPRQQFIIVPVAATTPAQGDAVLGDEAIGNVPPRENGSIAVLEAGLAEARLGQASALAALATFGRDGHRGGASCSSCATCRAPWRPPCTGRWRRSCWRAPQAMWLASHGGGGSKERRRWTA